MNVAARTAYYADATGLSPAAVTYCRKHRVRDWPTSADRKSGSTICAAERLAVLNALARVFKHLARIVSIFGHYRGCWSLAGDVKRPMSTVRR